MICFPTWSDPLVRSESQIWLVISLTEKWLMPKSVAISRVDIWGSVHFFLNIANIMVLASSRLLLSTALFNTTSWTSFQKLGDKSVYRLSLLICTRKLTKNSCACPAFFRERWLNNGLISIKCLGFWKDLDSRAKSNWWQNLNGLGLDI